MMNNSPPAESIGAYIAGRLLDHRDELVRRWLDRIAARVSVQPNRVFPSEDLLDHVPLMIEGIAHYIETPEGHIDGKVPVLAKAMELGALRHAQNFDAYEILKEQELLSAVLFTFLEEILDETDIECSRVELVSTVRRLTHAIELIRQATTTHFFRLSAERVAEREGRLRRFNRTVSHELKNRVSAIRGAGNLLSEEWITPEERERFHRMVAENAAELQHVLENLEALSRLDGDSRQQRNVLLPQAAAEAVRQIRSQAQREGVRISIADNLPAIEVNAAAVELCLANYLSNAIKYSDHTKADRWVLISGEFEPLESSGGGGRLIVRVRDNGIGIPEAARDRLFQRFYRAHGGTVTGVEGTGLGLSIVLETVESLGGRAWAEFPAEGGPVMAFSLPSRREEDVAAAGITRR